MKMAIELDVFQEIKLDENSGEIVMRPMAEGMDMPLDFIDEEGEPEWTSLLEVLTETMIDPYVVSASTEVPNEKDYHMMVAASEDLFSVANDFARKVEELHTIDPKEYEERMKRFEQGTFWPSEDHEPDEEK
jgi:hypothetical protein